MSGRLIEFAGGKVPQRAIRHLGSLPYCSTYHTPAAIDFGNTGDDAFYTFTTPTNRRGKVLEVGLYGGAENFAGTTDKAFVAIGTTDAGSEIAYTPDIADGALTPITYTADNNLINGSSGNVIEPGDLVYCCGMDAEGTPTGQCFVSVTFLFFE